MMRRWAWTAMLAVCFAVPAAAHDFWIQPASFWLQDGQTTTLGIKVGHGPARQPWVVRLNRVVLLQSIGPGSSMTPHDSALQQGTYAPDAELSFHGDGVHVVYLETTPAQNALAAELFNDYIKLEGVKPAIRRRDETHTTDQPGRERYSRRAKALVQVGAPSDEPQPQVTTPLGMTLEIVPEIDPYAPHGATALPVRIFYEGEPLPEAYVKLTDLNADEKPVETHETDADGRATFQLPQAGEWQMNVVWTKPVEGDPDVEFETTFASLAFGFSHAP